MVKLSIYLNYGTSYGKRATGVQAIEVLLHSEHTSNITKTHLFKYIETFTTKNGTFSDNKINSDIFQMSAQNIDCGYSLEPPRRGRSNEYPQSIFLPNPV